MKHKVMAIVPILIGISILFGLFAVDVHAEIVIDDDEKFTMGGYFYESWRDMGIARMNIYGDGLFKCSWSNTNNALFRAGKKFENNKTYKQFDNISVNFNCNFQTDDGLLGVYGITYKQYSSYTEYYIIESCGKNKPQGGILKGTITIDDGTYIMYDYSDQRRLEIPYHRYWSVRQSNRTRGTVSVSEHFKAWESKGIKMDTIDEVSLMIEGYQSGGNASVDKVSFDFGSPQVTNTPTITPDGTPVKCIEDINGDGAINMADIVLLASFLNTAKRSERYNEKYDLDENGAINMSDVMIIAARFNQLV